MDLHMHCITFYWSFFIFCCCCSCAKFRGRISVCPDGYSLFESACYKVSADFASYAAAEAQCSADGGFLAVPDHQEAHAHLEKLASGRPGSYWIGIRKEASTSRWVRSGLPRVALKFTSWAPGEPPKSKSNDNCAIMLFTYKYHWVSTGCQYSFRYICQINRAARAKEDTRCEAKLLKEKHHVDIKGLEKSYIVGCNVSASCERGYATNARAKETLATCETSGSWTIANTCLAICELPKDHLPLHAIAAEKDEHVFLAGDTLKLGCEEGYRVKGSNNGWRCLENGTWAEESFQCILEAQTRCPGTPEYIEDLVVSEGLPVSIPCVHHFRIEPRSINPHLQPDGEATIWMKELDLITPQGNISIDPLDSSLTIDSMTANLEGLYTCVTQAASRDNIISRSVRLILKRVCRKPLFDVVPEDSEISDSGYAILRCRSRNSIVEWFRHHGTVVANVNEDQPETDWETKVLGNGALLVRTTGVFECVANMIGQEGCQSRKKVGVSLSGTPRKAPVDICGRPMVRTMKSREESLRGKVVGGTEVAPGSHPWMALIEGDWRSSTSSTSRLRVFCGGSLISDLHVVTAAHCFEAVSHLLDNDEDLVNLKVKLGKHDRVEREPNEIVRTVSSVTVHPAFDISTFDSDVAVIKLDSRVSFSPYVQPICLPSKGFLSTFISSTKKASGLVAGWGQLQEEGARPLELREVRLPLVDDRTCRRSTNETVTANMFCAGYELETNDACKGDSGGPFEVETKGIVYLAGIVSWGEGCGRPRTYGFYTKVETVEAFVAAVMERREPTVARVAPAVLSKTRRT